MKNLLVANRGEIAVRIMHAAAELGVRTVAIFSEDDARSLHAQRADEARPLSGVGVAAYLDGEQILAIAQQCGCDAIHPGYGFLSENAAFARRAASVGITFVGPRPETLEIFGDKTQARALAERCGVPVLRGTAGAVTRDEAKRFLASLGAGGAMMIKAVAGGGGRGMRVVRSGEEVDNAYTRCQSEARQAFGNGDVYVERFMPSTRHIEVQIVGDGSGTISHLGERDCSIQRRHQKLVEIAPCPSLSLDLRARLTADAVRMAASVSYLNAGTFEFLVDAGAPDTSAYAFIEANPRLQVEHTVTEEVFGLDLVRMQLQIAAGQSLVELGLRQSDIPAPRGFAVQVRINTETFTTDGVSRPASGTLVEFELPSGHGVRTDTCGYVGYQTNPNFDSLLAKLIGHSTSPHFADTVTRTARALGELRIEGVRTNISFLQRLLAHPDFVANRIHTRFVEDQIAELAASEEDGGRRSIGAALTGAKVDANDPLAVLAYGKTPGSASGATSSGPLSRRGEACPEPGRRGQGEGDLRKYDTTGLDDCVGIHAPMQGTIVSLEIREGDAVQRGQALLIMNAMKMEHVVQAPASGVVRRLTVAAGDTVPEGHPLVFIEARELEMDSSVVEGAIDLDHIRPDLAEVRQRHAITLDGARADAVARRRKTGQRTARENITDLCDPETFVEYGALQVAAQRQRRSLEDLIERTPADGLVAGVGRVNGDLFDEAKTQCAVLSYDYTVLAGTQGFQNHRKKDRMFELAERLRIPVVFFTEGGGGRPGDTDAPGVAGLDCMAFHLFGRLSGLVPLVGINSGRCFAGNAALLGCCDVVIATANSNIGMGGPAMIEGGGLGVFRPDEIGPMSVQVPNGVVDIAVKDEAEAVRVAKQYLSYFQGSLKQSECADQRLLRGVIPENRLRIYDVRQVIETLADTGSMLELRPHFGLGMITALIRIEGRPVGVIANNPKHLSGAIDSPGADKAARFMQLCDAFDIPILSLCDTPGIMVGPEVEKTALVRHACRMFVTGASVSVPFCTIILRKGYGLGAQAMAGGSFKAPLFTVAWPTGEFGGMGLEGAVKLGFRKELAAVEDPEERKQLFDHMVARAYEHGKGLNMATHFEIDDVIDPAESRRWVTNALRSAPARERWTRKKRPCVDTW
ncbi:MAG: carbamoyl-phosphate synthase large subunit [Deltaproteobacteria bacterium]|nr:carbamoyl-phosphate synthase large subunit [Deltaproteobacteria bacterium]MBI3388103.1 carbamoyl-phosphate synthase large subunit [Deltaproteobacteria bacterium]